jgi:hypothetical protein
MTDSGQERAYRWPRRFIFAITLAVVIAVVVLCVLLLA